jgi:hypothetical protein
MSTVNLGNRHPEHIGGVSTLLHRQTENPLFIQSLDIDRRAIAGCNDVSNEVESDIIIMLRVADFQYLSD